MINYIGFATCVEFINAISKLSPINVTVGHKHGKAGKYGISIDEIELTLSQAQPQASEILYFQCAPYRWQALNGSPLERDENKPARIAAQVEAAVHLYLTELGIQYRNALLAMPTNLMKMHGNAEFLAWDKETESYTYHRPYAPSVED